MSVAHRCHGMPNHQAGEIPYMERLALLEFCVRRPLELYEANVWILRPWISPKQYPGEGCLPRAHSLRIDEIQESLRVSKAEVALDRLEALNDVLVRNHGRIADKKTRPDDLEERAADILDVFGPRDCEVPHSTDTCTDSVHHTLTKHQFSSFLIWPDASDSLRSPYDGM